MTSKRRCAAMQYGHLLPMEQPDADAMCQYTKAQKVADHSFAKTSAQKAFAGELQIALPNLTGVSVWFDPDLVLADMNISSCIHRRVQERQLATAFVVKDVLNPPQGVLWQACLAGLHVLSASCFAKQPFGPWIKFKQALTCSSQHLWLTPQFVESHPKLARILSRTANQCQCPLNQWRLYIGMSEEQLLTQVNTEAGDRAAARKIIRQLSILATVAEAKRRPNTAV